MKGMRVEGAKKLNRQLGKFKKSAHKEVVAAIRKNTEETANIARTLVPVATGELRDWISTEYDKGGMRGAVQAAPPTKSAQRKARAVEFGRQKGNRGTTSARRYIRGAQAYMAKRSKGRMKRAINKAAKEAFNG